MLPLLLFITLISPASASPTLVVAQPAEHTVTLTGFTRARTVMNLSSETSGKIERVFADVGDGIPEQGYFACLDDTYIDLEIESNKVEGKRLEVEIDYYHKQVKRYVQLVRTNSTAQSQLDEFERHLGSFRLQLEANRVAGRILDERKRRHCIGAVPGWRVIERFAEPGQWVNAGEVVAKVGDYSRLLIPYALTPLQYQALLHDAEHLELRLVEPDLRVPARIERVSPAFDEQSRKIKLDLQIDECGDSHRGGLRAELNLRLPLQSGAVLVPSDALVQRYEEYWLQRADGEEVNVVFLGRAKGETLSGQPLVRVSSPEVRPGDRFRLHPR